MKYRNVLFDIDNTLINSADLIAKLLKEGAEREGVYVPLQEFRTELDPPGNEILNDLGFVTGDVYWRNTRFNSRKI
ncbi:hypothetical protein S101258_00972 [Lactiplantibacillus plantarum subsp. plantarum]|uniref:Phosphoglycolate phosphatase n=1 Tax=Lactiplantibacillus plantarum subsp. plantarum TaxID=337330 RepID=A0A2S3U7J4_LACPN|nr:hypothetical protein S101258_00972 [Lactiplantibacillus plantarum subsp. plantarum]